MTSQTMTPQSVTSPGRSQPLKITILGLSLTSSWGNGHATIYRALCKALVRRGHKLTFLERDMPWYASTRDLPRPPVEMYGHVHLYDSLEDLAQRHHEAVAEADLVMVGSFVPEGAIVGRWVNRVARGITTFYDIDTPVTLAKLAAGQCDYLTPELVRQYRIYFSFTGGPILSTLQQQYGSPCAQALYCCVDPDLYDTMGVTRDVDLGYMGTYSSDRQPGLERLLLAPAQAWPQGQFMVAGPQYPSEIRWPANVARIEHLPPGEHRAFYCRQRFTLNLTRADMRAAGHAPSVRLFEAAACSTPVITDRWEGLSSFFEPGQEILLADDTADVMRYLREIPEDVRLQLGQAARRRCLAHHTAAHRALELEQSHAAVAAVI